jgi:6,7-dimethyl-8-ribityllumazine synthase
MSDPDLRDQPPRWPPSLEPDEELPAFRRADPLAEPAPEPLAAEPEAAPEPEPEPEHAAGDLRIPEGYSVIEGSGDTNGRGVGIVVARFNGDITRRLLHRALEELEEAGIEREAVTIVPVPGAFELPLAAMALAKTRKCSCIVALGCVIRGDTPHFDFVAGEAASGLQLAAIETGVPVSFGVLTTETTEQAEARIDRAGDAVRSALEMAGLFSELRAAAK